MTTSLVGNTFFGLDLGKIKSNFSQLRRRVSKRVLLIEFGMSSVNFAEVQVHNGSIVLDHIRRYPLPDEALERGIPTDPAQMASLIKGHCIDEDIPAHRAAVVIPPDAAFTTLVQLPADVVPADAVAYALDPASPVQVPIPLDQTDAELIPLDLPQQNPGQRNYFLTAVPRKLVDRLLDTINLADLELLRLQVGTFAQLNQLAQAMTGLAAGELILHVELLRECSLASLVSGAGPIKLVRLTAIREFPEPEDGAADVEPSQTLSTERQIVASDRYMPLSDLDLRRLVQELKQMMAEAELQFPWLRWQRMVLAGPNSAHPMLADLLQESMGLPVELCRPLAIGGVGLVELKQPILMQRLGRLVGLGLSFLDTAATAAEAPELPLPDPEIPPASVAMEETPLAIESPFIALEPLEPLDVELVQEPLPALEPEPAPAPEAEPEPEAEPVADLEPEQMAVTEEGQPLFSFAALDDEAQWPTVSESLAESADTTSAPAIDAPNEEAPFSMGDLISSFEARQGAQPEQALPEVETAAVHLIDDPSLWPTVVKEASAEQMDLAEEGEP